MQQMWSVVDQSGSGGGPARCSMRLVDFAAYVHAQQAARLEQADAGAEASGGGAARGAARRAAKPDSEPLSLFEHALPPELRAAAQPVDAFLDLIHTEVRGWQPGPWRLTIFLTSV